MLLPRKACLLRSRFQYKHAINSFRKESTTQFATSRKSSESPQEVLDISPRLLISEINGIPAVRLFPSQKKLITKFKAFLVHRFVPEAVESTHDNYKDLNEILAKIYLKNDSLAAYVDACLQTAEVNQALKSLNSRREESRFFENVSKGSFVEADIIFELLCRHFALKNDWLSIEKVLFWLKDDGLTPSFNTLLASLECLGALLQRTRQTRKTQHAGDQLLQPYLEGKIAEILSLAEDNNINLYEGLLSYPRMKNSLRNILTALLYVQPGRYPQLSFFPFRPSTIIDAQSQMITDRVSSTLRSSTVSKENVYADVFADATAMTNAFQTQLKLEMAGTVSVAPVLPFFEDMCKTPKGTIVALAAKSGSPVKTTRTIHKNLMLEQSLWSKQLMRAFEATLQRLKSAHAHGQITAYPFLKIMPRKAYVDLLIRTVNSIITDSELQHVSRSLLLVRLGERVEAACAVWRKQNLGIIDELKLTYEVYANLYTSQDRKTESVREAWLRALQVRSEDGICLNPQWPQWNSHIRLMVGQELYRILYDHLTFNLNGVRLPVSSSSSDKDALPRQEAPVLFEVSSENPAESRCEIRVHPILLKWYRLVGHMPLQFEVTELPMLCPPIPWIDTSRAGYLLASSDSTRLIRRPNYFYGTDAAANDDLDFDASKVLLVLDALNALASCPWKVNTPILDALIQVGRSGGDSGLTIPETKSLPPLKPKKISRDLPREERAKAYKESYNIRKTYDETRSLWATEMYRLSIANQYRDKIFWFPHSMDFRGRVYPCPPHFHHMGSDVARGLIVFAKGLPLGENGLRWLKIHLANLSGRVKRSANFEREAFTDKYLDEVLDSADKPFDGRGWWREQEEPWQTLACCRELAAALRHRSPHTGELDPADYVSFFPVHQDGSCNGLQHYAAMGRDERGAVSVSLRDCERPRDVYGDVTEVVESQRAVDAAAGMPVAQALEGFVQRKVIKQSVMTTVYGVTLYGAMAQIRRQLKEIPEFPHERWLGPASAYLARLTLASISAIFTSSSETQAWFGRLSRHITKDLSCRISWVTPLGLPVVQPYVKSAYRSLEVDFWSGSSSHRQLLDISALTRAAALAEKSRTWKGAKDSLVSLPPPNPIKQKNAFPPNFIHSLDSCHMMLTALHCYREGILFASVHDCFWTHAASVDRMNRICREEFVALHSEPLLENLSDYLRAKFEYSQTELSRLPEEKRASAEEFNKLLLQFPKRGNFNIKDVLTSTYFFS